MRIVFLIGMLAALGGCAVQRDVTFIYYPNAPHREKDPFPPASRFYAVADRECGLYGMHAVHVWDSIWDFGRVRVNYTCVQ